VLPSEGVGSQQGCQLRKVPLEKEIRMRGVQVLGLVSTLLVGFAAPAKADPVFFDDFEGVTSGGTILNWNGGTNWDVIWGTVDLVQSGDGFGIT
jgi:hypothetical protein